jgi:hypothetical protein
MMKTSEMMKINNIDLPLQQNIHWPTIYACYLHHSTKFTCLERDICFAQFLYEIIVHLLCLVIRSCMTKINTAAFFVSAIEREIRNDEEFSLYVQ